jgi:hypothetical protein
VSINDWDWSLIPLHCRLGLRDYIEHGHETGGFLYAVLSNDLKMAVRQADDHNRTQLHNYVTFLYRHAPLQCWGSPERVAAWIERGGLNGKQAA